MNLNMNAGSTVAACFFVLVTGGCLIGYVFSLVRRRELYFAHQQFMVQHGNKAKEVAE